MITPTIATFVWDCVWQSTLWLALGGLAGLFWRHWPARAHRIMVLALLGCLATPFLSLIVRQSGWGLLTRPAPGMARYFDDETFLGFVSHGRGKQAPGTVQSTEESLAGISQAETAVSLPGASPKPGTANAGVKFSISPLGWLIYAWIALSVWVLLKMIVSAIRELSILRNARPITEPKVQEALEQALAKLDLRGTQPRIRVSDQIRCPVIFCWGRQPTLLLPAGCRSADFQSAVSQDCILRDLGEVSGVDPCRHRADCKSAIQQIENLRYDIAPPAPRDWEPDDLVGLLSHELAHWKRRDHWAALLGELAVCVLPWQPLVWWAKRRLEHLSELACDHWVLASGQPAEAYAEALLSLAPQREAMLALPAVKHRGKLENRIRCILQNCQSDPKPGGKWAWAAAIVFASLGTVMALIQVQTAAATVAQTAGQTVDASEKSVGSRRAGLSSLVIMRLEFPENVLKSAALDFSSLAISPDGRKVAFIPDENYRDIDITDLQDGKTVRVTDLLRRGTTNNFSVDSPIWSRDGRRLAFNYHPGGSGPTNDYVSLRLVSAGGGDIREIYRSKSINPQDWSQDGKWILASVDGKDRTRDLILIPTEGGELRRGITAPRFGQNQRLSPDGKLIAFQRRTDGQFGVFLRAIGDDREIPVGPSDQINMSPHWTRDGRHLLFKSNRSGLYDFWAQRIENGQPAGEPVRVKADVGQRTDISQVLNNGQIVYFTWAPGMGIYRVSMNPETGGVVGKPKLVTFGRNGAPSPDGRRVAYNSFDWGTGTDSNLGLRVSSIDGKEERTIAVQPMNRFVCQWFPDGNSLLIGGFVGGQRGVYRVELATGKLETFYRTNAFVSNQRVSPDGQRIAFGVNFEGKGSNPLALYLVKASEGAQPSLLRYAADESSQDPTWSPDGKSIAFVAEHYLKRSQSRILIISANGGEAKELVRHEHEVPDQFKGWRRTWFPTWSPNGKFIAYSRFVYSASGVEKKANDQREEVWMVRAEGGTPFHLPELDGYEAFNCHWSADGKELFFTGKDPKSGPATEYWTLENYLPEEKRAGL